MDKKVRVITKVKIEFVNTEVAEVSEEVFVEAMKTQGIESAIERFKLAITEMLEDNIENLEVIVLTVDPTIEEVE